MQKDVALLKAFVIDDDKTEDFKEFQRYTQKDTVQRFTFDIYRDAVNERRQDTLTIPKFKEDLFLATIELDKPKLIYLSIPYNENWKIKANGEEVELHKVNIGFTGIKLNAGEYKLVIKYGSDNYTIIEFLKSILKMLPGIALLIGILYIKKRKNW